MIVEIKNDINTHLIIDMGNPSASGFALVGIEGIASPEASISMDVMASGNGSRFNSSRSNARNIVFNLIFDRTARPIEETRRLCYKIFPVGRKIEMTFTTKGRTTKTSGYVETNATNLFSEQEGAQISVLCESAYMSSTDETLVDFSGVADAFEFPFDNNSLTENLIELSYIYSLTEMNIINNGEESAGFEMWIRFKESVSNLTITNETDTKQVPGVVVGDDTQIIYQTQPTSMTFSDITFNSGSYVHIKTFAGDKSAWVYNWGELRRDYSLLNKMSGDWLKLIRGDNIIKVEGDGLLDSSIEVGFSQLYAGV